MFQDNPILYKEIKVRMRVKQSRRVQMAVMIMVGIVLAYVYWSAISQLLRDPSTSSGEAAWAVGFWIQATLLMLLCPSLAANAITQEKEQQTWEMLLQTRLLPGEIIFGKLIARLIPVALILIAFLPIMLFAFFHTLLPAGEFLLTYLALIIVSLFLTTLGLFMSWTLSKTAFALSVAYTILGALLLGTLLLDQMYQQQVGGYGASHETFLLWFNPAYLLMNVSDRGAGRPQDFRSIALTVGLTTYTLCTAFMLWRMIAGFRGFTRK